MSRYIEFNDAVKVMACEMYAEAQSQGYDVDGVEDFISEATAWMNDAPSIDLDDYVPREFHDKTCEAMAKRHQKEIEDIPDIVRCKDCKKANTEDCSHSYWDDDWGEWHVGYRGDDWFCADGEREGE